MKESIRFNTSEQETLFDEVGERLFSIASEFGIKDEVKFYNEILSVLSRKVDESRTK